MLVLSRRKTEVIRIGDNIEIHVVKIGHGRVRLGIQAPREVLVLRSETTVPQAVGAVHDTTWETAVETPVVSALPHHLR